MSVKSDMKLLMSIRTYRERKPRPTKFVPGGRLRTIADLIAIHRSKTPYVYRRGRPRHTSWIINWSVIVVQFIIERGDLIEAIPNPAYKEKPQREIPF